MRLKGQRDMLFSTALCIKTAQVAKWMRRSSWGFLQCCSQLPLPTDVSHARHLSPSFVLNGREPL